MTNRPKRGRDRILEIPTDVHDAMIAHCLMDSPLECCGILGGVFPLADLFYPLVNIEQSETSYNADPDSLIKAHLDLRAREADVLAIYHSHPRWAAIPSKSDLARNFHGPVPRIIVSLLTAIPEVRVWRLDAETYEELAWTLV